VLSSPNSEGMKKRTPAATAASITACWSGAERVGRAETTASMPVRAAVREGREVKSTFLMRISGGKVLVVVVVEDSRTRTVMDSNGGWAARRAWIMCGPRFPVA